MGPRPSIGRPSTSTTRPRRASPTGTCTIFFVRFFYRVVRSLMGRNTPAEHPVERAARLTGFPVPAGYVARPKRWQHDGFRKQEQPVEPPPPPDPQATPTPAPTPAPKPRWKPIKAS